MPYIGTQPTKVVSRQSANVYRYEATAGQTAFTGADLDNNVLACNPADMIVHMNGLRLESTDYTATSTTVTLTTAATAGDEVTVTSFQTFEVADTYTKTTADNRYVNTTGDTMTGGLTIHTGTSDAANLLLGNTANNWSVKTGTTSNSLSIVDNQFATRMSIDSAGRVTMPYQPAFYAYNLNFPYQTTGAAVGGAVMTNIGSGYNGTTGRFTAPVTGTYIIHVMTQYYSDGLSTYQTAAIYKNGTSIGAESWHGNSGSTGNYHTQANTCVIVTLNANDYVQAYTYYGSRDIQNFFCGYLIG